MSRPSPVTPFTLFLLFTLFSCSNSPSPPLNGGLGHKRLISTIMDADGRSHTAGNLVAMAMKEVHDLDIVLFPTALLPPGEYRMLKVPMSPLEAEELASLFPTGAKGQFLLGTMKGKDIKTLISERIQETYQTDLQVAGMEYDIHLVGGVVQYQYFTREFHQPFEDEIYYRTAISNYFYFSGPTFPSYKYRNNLNFTFAYEERTIDARESLRTYLQNITHMPSIHRERARFSQFIRGDAGLKGISQIQGNSHRSPFYGYRVTTKGIVTAFAGTSWYPGGIDVYIQTPPGEGDDGDDRTSEALHVYLDEDAPSLEMGDEITVTGVVYEQMTDTGLGRTSLRKVDNAALKILSRGNPLPPPVLIGREGRKGGEGERRRRGIPHHFISTYKGDLNLKPGLNLEDGIDFWESLEGMRIQVENPRVLGFRGGQEELESRRPKTYLNLYILPDGDLPHPNTTPAGGLHLDTFDGDQNPDILPIITNHMTVGLKTDTIFNVGDLIQGTVTGLLSYEKNIFGQGEYTMLLPEVQEAFTKKQNEADWQATPLEDRPQTSLVATERQLTIATYNVENLASYQNRRLQAIARSIALNLKCPDILNLVEIQDDNGFDFSGTSSAALTLANLIDHIPCPEAQYHSINIDPLANSGGGQPGSNIRVAMIYNARRVSFRERPIPGPLAETIVKANGIINYNPGHVFPNDQAFHNTRKSIVAQFDFLGERIFLIGNHFNSKLGDQSPWMAQQPHILNSENRRSLLADKINDFVQLLAMRNPTAFIAVLGDFNSLILERPMQVLEGNLLTNLISYGDLVPPNDRYTINFNGNSESLDYIFVNENFLRKNPELDVIHFNTDYMRRLSDHDPLIARFSF